MKIEIEKLKIDDTGEKELEIIHDTDDGQPFRINLMIDGMMYSRIEISENEDGFIIEIWDPSNWSGKLPEHRIKI
jgi:hypothetical protein